MEFLIIGIVSILPLTLGMPVGEILTKNFSVNAFEKLILLFDSIEYTNFFKAIPKQLLA